MTETETATAAELGAPQQQRATLDLVFVDPDDSSISWWWPALVRVCVLHWLEAHLTLFDMKALNRDDLPAFRAQTQGQVEEPAIDQVMVCYLEDGSLYVFCTQMSCDFFLN